MGQKSGLGWVGKNTLLINQKAAHIFLAELLINLEIEPDVEINDHCGTCTRCIDACPTDAIAKDGYTMDGSKCISYLTIELKEDEIPIEFKDKMEDGPSDAIYVNKFVHGIDFQSRITK